MLSALYYVGKFRSNSIYFIKFINFYNAFTDSVHVRMSVVYTSSALQSIVRRVAQAV
jgi:hypothetical protein